MMNTNHKLFSYYVLSQDYLYSYLTQEDASYYVQESEKMARKEADKYNLSLIHRIIKKENIVIKFSDKFFGFERSIIEINESIYTITLYERAIKILMNIQSDLSKDDIVNMLIVHEFYHYLEYKNNRLTNKLLNKINYKVGFVKRKSSILKTREIAAHYFTYLVLNMKYHPVYYDCIQLSLSENCKRDKIENELQQLERKYINGNSKLSW